MLFHLFNQHQVQPVELSFLAYLRGRCRSLPSIFLGIGDDAAAMEPSDSLQLSCTDQIIDGVDFLSSSHKLSDAGFKAMAINISDIAAMGGTPNAALVTLTLPCQNSTSIAGEVYEGILEAASKYNITIAGGDISTYDGPLAISVCLLGEVSKEAIWRRSDAIEGDAILVTGPVGGSLLGRHLRPEPKIELARTLQGRCRVNAAIDISDGLSLDLDRLCAASGVGAELDIERIPIHPDAIILSETSGRTPFQHAWSDGEDFELLLTMKQQDADNLLSNHPELQLTQIGNTVGRTGLWKRNQGKLQRLPPQGYVHDLKPESPKSADTEK
ncbi:thiamine-phosphate kinase [bacterium]|nr:thiamine-phosphate kinase [bacterium]